jgi:hypothetical protein
MICLKILLKYYRRKEFDADRKKKKRRQQVQATQNSAE